MGTRLSAAVELGKSIGMSACVPAYEFEQQCLRILRCTAQALVNSPGGLRFRAGTRPWLDALSEQRRDVSMAVQHGG